MTNLSGKLLTNDAVYLPPSRKAFAKSDLKWTTSTALFNVTTKSNVSAEYSTESRIFFNGAGPLSLSQTYFSPAFPFA